VKRNSIHGEFDRRFKSLKENKKTKTVWLSESERNSDYVEKIQVFAFIRKIQRE
jgi:hypothetical protein